MRRRWHDVFLGVAVTAVFFWTECRFVTPGGFVLFVSFCRVVGLLLVVDFVYCDRLLRSYRRTASRTWSTDWQSSGPFLEPESSSCTPKTSGSLRSVARVLTRPRGWNRTVWGYHKVDQCRADANDFYYSYYYYYYLFRLAHLRRKFM
jgi:hypothetical protein